jgi:DNA-binding transcriptional MocR family regulator
MTNARIDRVTENQQVQHKLYEQIAARIAGLIEGGTLTAGARVPSVRQLSAQQGISISTALQAYRVLENEGWIEARPQSGYYVRRRAQREPGPEHVLPEPEIATLDLAPTPVLDGQNLMRALHLASQRKDMLQLGAAICCSSFLPTQQLHRAAMTVLKREPELCNSYDFPPGVPRLRTQIARRLLEGGVVLTPDDLVLTVGATEGLNLCLRAVTKPGDAVAVGSPTYFGLLQIIQSLDLRAVEVPAHPRDGVVLEALEDALEREKIAACMFMPSFGNPLGARMPDENKKRLVEMLEGYGVPLIEDDVWADSSFDSPRPRAAKSFDRTGNVMLVSSFSKTLAPGYRVGYVAGGKWHRRVEYLKTTASEASPTLPSLAIAEFLEHGGYDYHLRRVRRIFAEQTQMALEGVARHFPEGTRVNRPRGGHFLWVELFEDALREGVSIAPGPMFSARQRFQNYVRLNCGYNFPEKTEKALSILGRLIREKM